MSLGNIFGIAGTALNAQLVRMNATASNLANAGTTASSEAEASKPSGRFSRPSLTRTLPTLVRPMLVV